MIEPTVALPHAGLARRLAALVYDGLLLVGMFMVATACFLPLTDGEAVTWARSPAVAVLHRTVLLVLFVGFYGLFWTRQGRTLGMASWRLRVERLDGRLPTWRDALIRLAAAALSWSVAGLGWLWCLVDSEGRTWHDALSGTRVVVVSRS